MRREIFKVRMGAGNMLKPFTLTILAIFVVGCQPVVPPAISDISDSMVKVQFRHNGLEGKWPDYNAVVSEARKGCAQYGKTPTLMSKWCTIQDGYGNCQVKEYLYTCN